MIILFTKVGTAYNNEDIPIISDGNEFYTLESVGESSYYYDDCYQVANSDGLELLSAEPKSASFMPVYKYDENNNLYCIGYIKRGEAE